MFSLDVATGSLLYVLLRDIEVEVVIKFEVEVMVMVCGLDAELVEESCLCCRCRCRWFGRFVLGQSLARPLLKQRHGLLDLLQAQFSVAVDSDVDSLEHHPLLEELSQKDQEEAELCNLDLIVALFVELLSLLE